MEIYLTEYSEEVTFTGKLLKYDEVKEKYEIRMTDVQITNEKKEMQN